MREPWEVFFDAWRAASGPAATRQAATQTLATLRGAWDWSLIHSRVLVGRFVEAADGAIGGGAGEEALRESLRSAWEAGRGLCLLERERRLATEAVLAAAGPAVHPLWARDEVADELNAW